MRIDSMDRVSRTLKFSKVLAALVVLVAGCGGAEPEPKVPHAPKQVAIAKHKRKVKARKKLPRLDADKVVQAIRGNEVELRKCFFRAPSVRGSIHVTWQVDAEGSVHEPVLEASTVDNRDVEGCLVERVSELRFGELEKPAAAEWTFVFRLAEPPDPKEEKRRAKALKKKAKRERYRDSDEPGVRIERGSPGWLEPGKIDDVVQFRYPLFARCYRDGIERHEDLKGAMRLRLVIDEEGRVDQVLDRNSDLPDRMVIDCVAESFYSMRFPKPQRGSVHVLYGVEFD
jgi:hypothetical protein